jgi:GTP-binding protein
MVGRSNVGKSTLINALLGRKGIARVSQTPGKTQAINFFLVNEAFYLVDLPGYGYAKVSRSVSRAWGELVGGYLETSNDLRVLILLLDARREPSEEDLEIRDWMEERGTAWQAVLTKTDKLSGNGLAVAKRRIAEITGLPREAMIGFSNVNRKGIPEIWRLIDEALR